MKWSMDRVQRGGPWTGSTGVVHGPGVHVFTRPFESCVSTRTVVVWC